MSTIRKLDWDQQETESCDVCRRKNSRGGHDWTLFCAACGTFFVYSGCSCDGCCGDGAYGMFGGGRDYELRVAGIGEEAVRLIQLQARIDANEPGFESTTIRWHDWAGDAKRLKQAAIAPLQKLLIEGTERERALTARVLGEFGPGVDPAALLQALSDPSIPVRAAAAAASGKQQIGAAFEPLNAALSSPAWELRLAAAEGLGELGDGRAAEGLGRLLADESYSVRKAAIKALHTLGTPEAYAQLCAACANPATPSETRYQLVGLLADVPGPEVDAALTVGKSDRERYVREYCAQVLRNRKRKRSSQR